MCLFFEFILFSMSYSGISCGILYGGELLEILRKDFETWEMFQGRILLWSSSSCQTFGFTENINQTILDRFPRYLLINTLTPWIWVNALKEQSFGTWNELKKYIQKSISRCKCGAHTILKPLWKCVMKKKSKSRRRKKKKLWRGEKHSAESVDKK